MSIFSSIATFKIGSSILWPKKKKKIRTAQRFTCVTDNSSWNRYLVDKKYNNFIKY